MEAFEAVYEELFPQVYRYLLVLCGDRDLAEELTQETFFQAIQHIDSFRGDCKLYVCIWPDSGGGSGEGRCPTWSASPAPTSWRNGCWTGSPLWSSTAGSMPCRSPIGRSFLSGYLESCPLERSLNSFPGQRAGPE